MSNWKVGDAIDGNWKSYGAWYPGKIARVNPNSTYDIDYNDGDKENFVPSSRIRKATSRIREGKGGFFSSWTVIGVIVFALVVLACSHYYYAKDPVESPVATAKAFDKLAQSSGAEDLDLWKVRDKAFVAFHTFFFALGQSPHVAIGMLLARSNGNSQRLDNVMFGVDEAALKSPFNWPQAILTPGMLACRYIAYFLDTNPFVASMLILNYFAEDLAFLIDLFQLAFVPKSSNRVFRSLVSRILVAIFLSSMYFFVLSYVFPHFIERWLFFGYVCTVPLYNILRVWNLLCEVRKLHRAYRVDMIQHENAKVDLIKAELKQKRDIIETTEWGDFYTRENILGKGSFGSVYSGCTKKGGHRVAIKISHPSDGQSENKNRLLNASLGALLQPELADVMVDSYLVQLGVMEEGKWRLARYEVQVLGAVRALKCPYLLELKSAHFCKKTQELAIITSLAGPSLDKVIQTQRASRGDKLLYIKRLFEAVAELHAGGIVHRDIKQGNLACHPDDMSKPIILDFGISSLPIGDHDTFILGSTGTPMYMPPEAHASGASSVSGDIKALGGGGMTTKADVWAMTLVAIELLLDNSETIAVGALCKITDEKKRTWVNLFSDEAWVRQMQDTRSSLVSRGVNLGLIEVLMKCLSIDPDDRLTAAHAAHHPAWAEVLRSVSASGQATSVHFDANGLSKIGEKSRLAMLRDLLQTNVAKSQKIESVKEAVPSLVKSLAKEFTAMTKDTRGLLNKAQLKTVLDKLIHGKVPLTFDPDALFDIFDEDKSGSIDRREFLSGFALLLAPYSSDHARLELTFEAYDVDGNGALSSDEFTAMMSSFSIPLLDANGESVSPQQARGAAARLASLFAQLDTNKDKLVSLAEFMVGIESDPALKKMFLS